MSAPGLGYPGAAPEDRLMLRKPGGYRKPAPEQEQRTFIATEDYVKWFSPIWSDVTGQQRSNHPAPYPVEIPRRLVQMFSFVGDTVVDPFAAREPQRSPHWRPDATRSPSRSIPTTST